MEDVEGGAFNGIGGAIDAPVLLLSLPFDLNFRKLLKEEVPLSPLERLPRHPLEEPPLALLDGKSTVGRSRALSSDSSSPDDEERPKELTSIPRLLLPSALPSVLFEMSELAAEDRVFMASVGLTGAAPNDV